MAGHILGLNLKPHDQIDLESDLQPAMEYILAKKLSKHWTKVCRNALVNFRRFLLHERGQVEIKQNLYEVEYYTQELPTWLVDELKRYQRVKQCNWRPARLHGNIRRFWNVHLDLWRFLCTQCGVRELADVRRQHLCDYVDHCLNAGRAASGINHSLHSFLGFLNFLQEQGHSIPRALMRVPSLKKPDPLPRFLTDEQVCLLRDEIERNVRQAGSTHARRDALLTRAAFYLLWQSGLRLSEVEELRLEDINLEKRKMDIRLGKGLKDRVVYLTATVIGALQDYLPVRGPGPTDHVFLYRNQPLCKDLVRERIKAAGSSVGVKVYPHRLRHTCATQLLNAGCKVTSIQKFLGHKELSTTMVYARVHDQTVEADYYAAMSRVEQRLELVGNKEPVSVTINENERGQLLALAEQLAEPELSQETRLILAGMLLSLLNCHVSARVELQAAEFAGGDWIPPPAIPTYIRRDAA